MEKRLIDDIYNWLENYKRYSVKQASYDRLLVSCHLLSHSDISEIPSGKIRTEHLQRYLNRLYGDGYSASTIKKQFTLLTAYFKYAISQGEVQVPMYMGVEIPVKQTRKNQNVRVYTKAEQDRLNPILDRLDNRIFGAAILMLEAGLRVGEVLALTWDDILWEKKAVSINKTWVRLATNAEAFIQDGAKSETSNRTIPLSKRALDILARIRVSDDTGSIYIFPNEKDPMYPATYSAVRHHLRIACTDARVPYKGTHALRHTFATNCYYRGCDVKVLSKLLGHADVAITYNTYIHLFGDVLDEMRKVIE